MVDLQQGGGSIAAHSRFFDYLVDLIPAKFYHGESEDRVHLQTMKKSARMVAKQQFKLTYKENKRAKLDPDVPATSLGVQKSRQAQKEEEAAIGGPSTLSGGSLSREELKARLQRKIESIQQQRSLKDKESVAQQAKQWRDNTLQESVKHKAKEAKQSLVGTKRKAEQKAEKGSEGGAGQAKGSSESEGGMGQAGQPHSNASKQQGKGKKGSTTETHPDSDTGTGAAGGERGVSRGQAGRKQGGGGDAGGKEGGEEDFQFARLEFTDNIRSRAKGSKGPSKEQLLAAAEAKAKEKAERAASETGRVELMTEAWKTALARTEGEKILDDPKLLRKSMKKEAKRKEKSGKAWQERKQHLAEQQQKKQAKREGNMSARTEKKIDNKREAREKKLLRAGFEGRKTGFIGGGGVKK